MRIGVDVDDVMVDMLGSLLYRHNIAARDHNPQAPWLDTGHLKQWECWRDVGMEQAEFWKPYTPDIYRVAQPIPGAIAGVKRLMAAGHDVVFITSCGISGAKNADTMATAKLEWLNQYVGTKDEDAFEFIPVGPEFQYKHKYEVPGVDVLIDDSIANVEAFIGPAILFSQPHNYGHACTRKRAKSWMGVETEIAHIQEARKLVKTAQTVNRTARTVTETVPVNHSTHICLPDTDSCQRTDGLGNTVPPVRKFETGATRDQDVDKYDYEGFISPTALERFGAYMHKNRFQRDGSVRDSDNWQKGIPKSSYVKSLIRHAFEVWRDWRKGVVNQDALCAVLFNAQGLLHEDLKAPLDKTTV
jgi:5'(3')-deoxyribonucleotidase